MRQAKRELTEARAERLGIILTLCLGWPYLDPAELAVQGLPSFSPAEVALMEGATEDDLALANACLELEQELRQRAFVAAEQLLGYAAAGEGELDDRLLALPLPRFAAAARCLIELGWID